MLQIKHTRIGATFMLLPTVALAEDGAQLSSPGDAARDHIAAQVRADQMKQVGETWRTWVLSFFRLVLLIFGYAATPVSGALAQWSTSLSGTANNGVQWQAGYYFSDNLQIYGLICTPPASFPGPYPVAILNHGVGGAGNVWAGCTLMAQYGWLTAISAYRGESLSAPGFQGTSQGLPGICDGDVDDVRNLLSIITAMPSANVNQVFIWGHSEGACITELAIEKGAKVQIAVSIDGPTDFTTWTNAPKPLIPPNPLERSSVWSGNNPAALNQVKLLRVQARGDTVVTPDQACELISKLPGSVNYYLNWNITPPGVYYGGSPSECTVFSMLWVNQEYQHPPYPPGTHPRLLPGDEPGKPYPSPGPWPNMVLLMYGLRNDPNTGKAIPPNNSYHGWIPEKAWPEIASFVNTFAMSGGWRASLPSAFVPFE